jgi:hypothetical protein
MSNLIRRQPPAAEPVVWPDRSLNGDVAAAEHDGIVAVSRVQAGAYVASVAMQNATMLSRTANAAFKISPMGEDIYQAIVMAYGTLAVAEIQGLGIRGRSR